MPEMNRSLRGTAFLTFLLLLQSVSAQSCGSLGGSGTSYKDSIGNSYTIACGKDVQISDLSSATVSSFKECFDRCGAISQCSAFSYLDSKCWFKNVQGSSAQPFARTGCDLAYRSSSFITPSCADLNGKSTSYTDQNGAKYDISCGINVDGSDVKNIVVSGFEDCFYQCGALSGCQGFTYIRSSKTCYLKNFRNTSGGPVKSTNSGMDTALMPSTAPADPSCKGITISGSKYTTTVGKREYQIACESDMNGSGDIGSKAVANFAACLDLCDSTSGCTAATFGQGASTCYMKSLAGRDINVAARSGYDFSYLTLLTSNPAGQKNMTGSWGAQIDFPLVPAAVAVIPQTGKLLVWSAAKKDMYTSEDPNAKYTLFADYDPSSGKVSPMTVANTGHDMFCPGISVDGLGRMIVSGGSTAKVTSIFDPAKNTWVSGPELKVSRGYQSSTVLSNGKVFTIGGSWSGGRGGKVGEIYDPATNSWSILSGCPVDPILTNDQEGVYRSDNHAWLVGWKDGSVFHAGPSKAMHWFGTTNSGSISNAGTRPGDDAMCGIFVMYDTGKILTAGGSPSYSPSPAMRIANTIALGSPGAAVQVQRTGDMAYPRVFANTVVLPNGEVLVTGGQSYAEIFTDNSPTQCPEMWSPKTGQFRVLEAKEPAARTYHSVNILLPDGTVFSGGGGLCGNCGSNNHFEGRIYTPPYLYTGNSLAARPAITAMSATTARVGASITLTVDTKTSAKPTFALLRVGTATHSVNTDQRRISLTATVVSGKQYTLSLPSDAGILPPGYYYVFALEGEVPSVSKTLLVQL